MQLFLAKQKNSIVIYRGYSATRIQSPRVGSIQFQLPQRVNPRIRSPRMSHQRCILDIRSVRGVQRPRVKVRWQRIQSAPTRRIYTCAVGRIIISFTSTSAGCSIANTIARAIASGGIASLSRDAASWAFTSGFVAPSVKFVRTKPGEMIVTRSLSPASWRKPSEMRARRTSCRNRPTGSVQSYVLL